MGGVSPILLVLIYMQHRLHGLEHIDKEYTHQEPSQTGAPLTHILFFRARATAVCLTESAALPGRNRNPLGVGVPGACLG